MPNPVGTTTENSGTPAAADRTKTKKQKTAVRTGTVGQADGRLTRYAAAVSAALVLGVTKVVGAALVQTRSVQRGDVAVEVAADRTLARFSPPLVQATAVTLRNPAEHIYYIRYAILLLLTF